MNTNTQRLPRTSGSSAPHQPGGVHGLSRHPGKPLGQNPGTAPTSPASTTTTAWASSTIPRAPAEVLHRRPDLRRKGPVQFTSCPPATPCGLRFTPGLRQATIGGYDATGGNYGPRPPTAAAGSTASTLTSTAGASPQTTAPDCTPRPGRRHLPGVRRRGPDPGNSGPWATTSRKTERRDGVIYTCSRCGGAKEDPFHEKNPWQALCWPLMLAAALICPAWGRISPCWKTGP